MCTRAKRLSVVTVSSGQPREPVAGASRRLPVRSAAGCGRRDRPCHQLTWRESRAGEIVKTNPSPLCVWLVRDFGIYKQWYPRVPVLGEALWGRQGLDWAGPRAEGAPRGERSQGWGQVLCAGVTLEASVNERHAWTFPPRNEVGSLSHFLSLPFSSAGLAHRSCLLLHKSYWFVYEKNISLIF